MDNAEINAIIASWAENEPLVRRAYIFGSRATSDYSDDSDLDIAVEIRKGSGDESVRAMWPFVRDEMKDRLAKLLPFKLQLECLDGANTPTILYGVRQSSILVYEEAEG